MHIKRFFLIIGLIATFWQTTSVAEAKYEFTENASVLSVNQLTRNIVIDRPGDDAKWLIHHQGYYHNVKVGGKVKLYIQNILDEIGDRIYVNFKRKLKIDQVDKINKIFKVNYVGPAGKIAQLVDQSGNRFDINYSRRCHGLPLRQDIYVYQFGSTLAKGDTIFLPNNNGQCAIEYVGPVAQFIQEQADPEVDKKRPSMPRKVRAMPLNGATYLKWLPAKDNVGIDHYIVGYSIDEIHQIKEWRMQDVPNQIKTSEPNLKITGLRNNEIYYFYVIAVDTSGNVSSHWSRVAQVRPRTSLPR